MLLDHLGLGDARRPPRRAITAVYAAGAVLPVDQGGSASTTAFADAVIAAVDA